MHELLIIVYYRLEVISFAKFEKRENGDLKPH